MSDRKSARRISTVGKRLGKLPQTVTKSMVTRLLRLAFMMNRRSRLSATGFVLPTVVLLILVVTLTTGALVFRAFNSSTNTIANNQNRVIQNAATPAIDRARAKLEYLFDSSKDTRLPSGVPSEQYLLSMMLNDGSKIKGSQAPILPDKQPYLLPDETPININTDTTPDTAWSYRADTNGDGSPDATVAYSILFSTPPDKDSLKGTQRLVSFSDKAKVDGEKLGDDTRVVSYARSGPISNAAGLSCGTGGGSRDGWYADRSSSSTLRKNFQIDAIVIPDKGSGGVTTLELQQDRQVDSGNKWGAWFRSDLEVNSGLALQWNGAMHTEGSLLVGRGGGSGNNFQAFLISSPASCLYEEKASEISVGTKGATGLVLATSSAYDETGVSAPIYIHSKNTTPPSTNLTLSTDWSTVTTNAGQITLKPAEILASDTNVAVGGSGNNESYKDAAKYDQKGLLSPDGFGGRIIASTEATPYVDDTYRADNRYGPKFRYDNQLAIPSSIDAGEVILETQTFPGTTKTGKALIQSEASPGDTESANLGLDGYWERRARLTGLRLLVGERLELGNAFGWGGSPATPITGITDPSLTTDPLYPPVNPNPTDTPAFKIRHEVQQNRTLRDNLSAVQATAIYHTASGTDKDLPVACLATTAHPGTPQTLANSINFKNPSSTTVPYVDFFSGRGTNGWEFAAPTQADVTTGNLRIALENLAKFAGDDQGSETSPSGAFPPTQEANIPHPYPMLTMWGNFSNLRRALRSGTYASLSPADKSYLYTAGCTVGMLAYNTNRILNFDLANVTNRDALKVVTLRLEELIQKAQTPQSYETAPLERLFSELEDPGRAALTVPVSALLTQVPTTEQIAIAKMFATRGQILRDRKYGFKPSPPDDATFSSVSPALTFRVSELSDLSATEPSAFAALESAMGLTTSQESLLLKLYGNYAPAISGIREEGIQPKWPALYYIFPTAAHAHGGASPILQPPQEPYIADTYVKNTVNPSSVSYASVTPADVVLQPKAATASDWKLPYETDIKTESRYSHTNFIINPSGVRVAVGFLDRVLYNGRERLPARVLDIDLGLLRQKAIGTTDAWLPQTGIVYAFREDAVREDGISRPAGATSVSAGGYTDAQTVKAVNASNPFSEQKDPPLAAQGISAKSVDYIPDPSRRIHGFRLRDGARLKRIGGVADKDNIRGLSFITDNPLYVMGNFNLHEATGTENPLEEFSGTDRLWNYDNSDALYTPARFYGRTTRDTNFAVAAKDEWRPSELLSDALTFLTVDFCDGSTIDGYWNPKSDQFDLGIALPSARRALYDDSTSGLHGPACKKTGLNDQTSFLNQNRPRLVETGTPSSQGWGPFLAPHNVTPNRTWLRENPYDPNSPVRISRNGLPLTVAADSTVLTTGTKNQAGLPPLFHTPTANTTDPYAKTAYQELQNNPPRSTQQPQTGLRINAIVVTGITPSRPNQYNGGLPNLPRFLEFLDTVRVWFSGSLLQLNFSNYADAGFDSEAWEPGETVATGEIGGYYKRPTRVWGYDVALQLAPASPAAARFVAPSATRSEFYTELSASDEYIKALCLNAKTPAGVNKPCKPTP